MVTGTGLTFHIETLLNLSFARLDITVNDGFFSALSIEHTFPLDHDYFGAEKVRCHRLLNQFFHISNRRPLYGNHANNLPETCRPKPLC